jgi:hypothetical protein
MAKLIQADFMQNPLAPLLVFVRQYFSMLPNITIKRVQRGKLHFSQQKRP